MKNLWYRFLVWLGIIKIPESHPDIARIDGSMLFFNDYNRLDDYINLSNKLHTQSSKPIIRVNFPVDKPLWNQTISTLRNIKNNGMEPLVLFDHYYSNKSILDRIDFLHNNISDITYFELFNELPHMHYNGEQIEHLSELITRINYLCIILKNKFAGCRTISMSPANSLQDIKYDKWGVDNSEQLEKLIKETDCDIIGIHCYVNNISQEVKFKKLCENLDKWRNGKELWMTETGIEGGDNHIEFYREWISRFIFHLKCNKILWYRQSIANKKLSDSEFALHVRYDSEYSALWDYIGQSTKSLSVKK